MKRIPIGGDSLRHGSVVPPPSERETWGRIEEEIYYDGYGIESAG